MAVINTHQFIGRVIDRKGPYAINENMNKYYLYCRGTYMVSGKEKEEDARFVTFTWGQGSSRVANVLPGDEVSFSYNLAGRYNPDKKGYSGEPVCYTECILSSKVEILNTSQRQLYKNDPSERPEITAEIKTQFEEEKTQEKDDDLPFGWFIPLLLTIGSQLIF